MVGFQQQLVKDFKWRCSNLIHRCYEPMLYLHKLHDQVKCIQCLNVQIINLLHLLVKKTFRNHLDYFIKLSDNQ